VLAEELVLPEVVTLRDGFEYRFTGEVSEGHSKTIAGWGDRVSLGGWRTFKCR
jgi:hypothetical protein